MRKKETPSVDATVQSNVGIKQTGDNSGKVQVNVQNKPEQNKKRQGDPGKRGLPPKKSKFQRFEEFTPLNTSLENVYLATRNNGEYKKPAPKGSTEA